MPDASQMEKRQRVLADFGEFALRSDDLDAVLTQACRLVAEALGTGRAKVLEIEHEGRTLFVRAGVGWNEGVVGHLRLPMGERSSETYSIEAGEPVVTNDVANETRFGFPAFLKDAGVRALANVPVFLPGGTPFGLLQVDAPEPRAFGDDDTQFLRTYAAILGPVIDRLLKVRALGATEARFRAIVEAARDYAIFLTDPEDRITDWLPGAEAVYGWTAEEAIGQPGAVLFTPEDRRAGVPEAEVGAAREGGSAPDVRWHLRKDGGRVFVQGTVVALRDEAGQLRGFQKIGQDVTQRRLAEEAQRESEARRAFLLGLSDALRPLSGAGETIEAASRLLAEHLGASRVLYFRVEAAPEGGRVVAAAQHVRDGEPFPERVPFDAFHEGAIGRVLEEGGRMVVIDSATDPRLGAAQRRMWLDAGVGAAAAVPLVKDGRVVAVVGAQQGRPRDWTAADLDVVGEVAERTWAAGERARAEAALRESEERFRTLAETIDDVFYVTDLDRHALEYLSPSYERVWGRPAAELLADVSRFTETVHEDDRAVRESGMKARRRLEPVTVEYRIRRPDGSIRHILDRTFPVPGSGGRRLAGVATDITDRKRAEAVLRESEERQAFLLELGDALRGETDERQVERMALDMLADQLSVDRAYITTSDYGKGETEVPVEVRRGELSPLVGIFRHADFPESAQQVNEGTLVVEDAETDASLSELNRRSFAAVRIKALIGVGLRKGVSDIFWTLAVATTQPRKWSPNEVLLMEEAAERIMAALARTRAATALRESEERFRLLLQSVRDYAIFTTDRDGLITSWPAGAAAVYGWSEEEILGRSVDLTFLPEDAARGAPREERETAAREGLAPNVREHLRKDGSRIFIDGSTQPLVGADGRVHEFIKIGQDVTEARRVQQALSESEGRLRTLMEGIPQLVWRSCDRGEWTWSSPQWQDFTGQSQAESHGRGWLDALHPDDREATLRAWEAARPHGRLDVEYRVRRASDGAYLWHHTRSVPVRDEANRIVEWLGTTTDVQQLKELQERQAVMVAELQHRTRNLIAVVRSIASQTMAQTGPTEAFRAEFDHRLEALARVQGLLSRAEEEPVTIEALIRMELDALGAPDGAGGRVSLSGPPVRLRSSIVQTLALGLHELATNARKHGALSRDHGRLGVTWRVREADGEGRRLDLEWSETGAEVSIDTLPERRGYGRELIERALPYALGAKTAYELRPEGVRCTIDLPLERKQRRGGGPR